MKNFDGINVLARFVVRRSLWVLAIATVTTIIGGYYTLNLPLESDLAELLPQNYTSVRTLRRINEEIGGFATLQILVEGNDFPAMKQYAEKLAQSLKAHPLVKLVDFKKDVKFYKNHALLYLPLEDLRSIEKRLKTKIQQEKLKYNPLYVELDEEPEREPQKLSFSDLEKKYEVTDDKIYYVNPEHTILVLNVYPMGTNSDIKFAHHFYKSVQEVVQNNPPPLKPKITIEYGGNFKNKIDEYQVILRDVHSSIASGLILVCLFIIIYFRQTFVVLIIGLPLITGLSWTFGLTKGFIGRLNTMTVFLFIVLFGLGIDFGIHLYARYREFRSKGSGLEDALHRALSITGRALLTSALTTSVAFYSLMLADFRGFKEFGFIAGSGILLSLVSMFMVFPGITIVLEKIGLTKPPGRLPQVNPSNRPRFFFSRILFALSIIITLASAFSLPYIRLEYDFTNLRSNLPESIQVKEKLGTIFKESNSPAIVIVDKPFELKEVESTIREHMAHDTSPTIDKFRSIYTMLPKEQEQKLFIIRRIRNLLTEVQNRKLTSSEKANVNKLLQYTYVKKVTPNDLPNEVRRLFTDLQGNVGRFAYIFPSVQLRDGRKAIAFAQDVKNIKTKSGKIYHAANDSVIFADMLILMLKEGRKAVILTFLTVFILVLLDFRHLKHTFLVLTPLIMGILWLVGLMVAIGIKINFYNMVVIPTIIGMGVDGGVHIYHRYRQEGRGSILYVMKHTGGAVLISILTTMVGFSGLVFAHHPGLNAIGKLALLGLSLNLACTLIFFPALLQTLENLRKIHRPMGVPRDATIHAFQKKLQSTDPETQRKSPEPTYNSPR